MYSVNWIGSILCDNILYWQVILDDLKLLQVDYDHFSRTSDHFDYIIQCAEDLIKKRLAYVDDTPQEAMQKEREQRIPSQNRENSKAGWHSIEFYCAYEVI